MRPAIFLDRDGVIVENRETYILDWSDVQFFPEALQALAGIRDEHYKVLIVTNQSAVGRGLMTLKDAEAINQRIVSEIEYAGGRIDGVYMCPHAPESGCDCRKPLPGLLTQAIQELSINPSRSILIGDALSDLRAAWAAGVPKAALVRTGRGQAQSELPEINEIPPFPIYENLSEALSALVGTPT